MKQITILIITTLCLLFSLNIYGQSKIYFNEDWKESTKENAHFYRVIKKKNDSLFHIKDFYINGVLQMDGHFSNLENEIFEGEVSFYNKQGKIIHSETYTKGKLNGLTTVYLKNEKIDYITEYKNGEVYNGKDHGAVKTLFYKNGVITKSIEHTPPNPHYILKTTIYGKVLDTVYWRTAENKQLGRGIYKNYAILDGLDVLNLLDNTVLTYYKNRKKEGIQKIYDGNGKLISNRTFKNNQLLKDETLNPLTNKMVTCTYKDNKPLNGRWFEYNPMYKYYDEYIFEDGIQNTHNRYILEENGKFKLLELLEGN